MPTQHDHLMDDDLRAGLRRRDPATELQLLRRYNRGRRPEGRLAVPEVGAPYNDYDGRLLALLWVLVRNHAALVALGQQNGWQVPDPPAYLLMDEELIAFLWTWGRDDQSLETLWTRRGVLPINDVTIDTPDAVLGFLWWRDRLPAARDELFRRYHLGGASDAAQDRALTLLLVIDRWDYHRYPTLDSLLAVSAARRRIDHGRRQARAPQIDQCQVDIAADPHCQYPETPVEARDFLRVRVPLELRALYKLRENSEEQPLDLTDEEVQYLIDRNRASGEAALLSKADIVAWMAEHPEPSEEQLRERFPWFRQSGLARQTRAWRLGWRADENDRLLAPLLVGAEESISDLACLVQEDVDNLARRVTTEGRSDPADAGRGPVLVFAELMDAAHRLRVALEARPLSAARRAELAAWQENLNAFLGAFPVLAKLARCRRLVYHLLHAGPPAGCVALFRQFCDWLDAGPWLSSLRREDRRRAQEYARLFTAFGGRIPADARAALDLLVLWLQATQQPGAPERRLLDVDRAWWLGQECLSALPPGLNGQANQLAEAANRGDWAVVAATAFTLSRRLAEAPANGWLQRDWQDCLRRLSRCC